MSDETGMRSLSDAHEMIRVWSTVVDGEAHTTLAVALPAGWSLWSDRWYCGSAECRVVEFHRDHDGAEHVGCFVTRYGPYPTLIAEVREWTP